MAKSSAYMSLGEEIDDNNNEKKVSNYNEDILQFLKLDEKVLIN